ncbi:hypothetical protein BP00DRAFT_428878 [Aspergillus indologenus CBS 114.80]|uniref:Uncharacterized protein n=1 Tax=Aspergillus indologenus CBS 114.80 TaxID=1450541 RepID=A0A2V5I225_9EURO|nr:hypothetical protein BP00DRAFT_428878 [Aspergillus indologenus CBS 114.80]
MGLVLTPARSSSLVPGVLSINPWMVDLGEPVSASAISSRNRGSLASHPHGLPRLPGWHWAEMSSSGEMRLSFPATSSWPLFDLLTIAALTPQQSPIKSSPSQSVGPEAPEWYESPDNRKAQIHPCIPLLYSTSTVRSSFQHGEDWEDSCGAR